MKIYQLCEKDITFMAKERNENCGIHENEAHFCPFTFFSFKTNKLINVF